MRPLFKASAIAAGVMAFTAIAASPAGAFIPTPPGGGDPTPPFDCVSLTTGTVTVSPKTFHAGDPVKVVWTTHQQAGCTVYKYVDGYGFGGFVSPDPGTPVGVTQTGLKLLLPPSGTTTWTLEVTGPAGHWYTLSTTTATSV